MDTPKQPKSPYPAVSSCIHCIQLYPAIELDTLNTQSIFRIGCTLGVSIAIIWDDLALSKYWSNICHPMEPKVDLRPISTDSESSPQNPEKSSTKSGRFLTRPGLLPHPPPQSLISSMNMHRQKRLTIASLINSYSARAYCRVISEIDTGLRNLRVMRTCNRWNR